MKRWTSSKGRVTVGTAHGCAVANIYGKTGALISQGFVYPNKYQHLRGLFSRYLTQKQVEEVMSEIALINGGWA
jgi:hypothetical protein